MIVDLSDANSGVDIKPAGKVRLSTCVPRFRAILSANLMCRTSVPPVVLVDTFTQGNTRMVIEPKGLWEHRRIRPTIA